MNKLLKWAVLGILAAVIAGAYARRWADIFLPA